MKIDVRRAKRIAERLRESGDTPAAELIEQLIHERTVIMDVARGTLEFEPAGHPAARAAAATLRFLTSPRMDT